MNPKTGKGKPSQQRMPKVGSSLQRIDPGHFQAGAQAGIIAFHAVTTAAGAAPAMDGPRIRIDGRDLRLNDQHPQIRSMMAFTEAYLEAGGTRDMVPHFAAVSRFFAFIDFLRAEVAEGTVQSWPEGMFRYDEHGIMEITLDLFRAAAIADLACDGKFNRDHLLAVARS